MKTEDTERDYYDWVKEVNHKFESIDWDIILFDNIKDIPYRSFPVKTTYPQICILTQGKIEIGIDLKRYTFVAPCAIFNGTGRISQYFGTSEDISMPTIVASTQFVKNLQLSYHQLLPMFLFIRDNISIPLKNDELDLLLNYYSLLNKILQVNDLFRIGSARHLVESLIFTLAHLTQPLITKGNNKKSRQDTIFGEFIGMLPHYYKIERGLNFYADKMCITPKHLSEVIKKVSQKSANSLIDSIVCLEAKALLKSSNMTIQQISDELNFPSQSFFGKYFKRVVGISPKEYRNK